MALRGGDVIKEVLASQQAEQAQLSQPKFALFAGDRYYPSGGWGDYVATFASLDDAYARYIQGPGNTDEPDEDGFVATYTYDWGHVVNMESGNIVARYY